MKQSKLARFWAMTKWGVTAFAVALGISLSRVVKAIFTLPTVLVKATALGIEFGLAKAVTQPQRSNAEINAEMARILGNDIEFLILRGSGKDGDEDRRLPFPPGWLASIGKRHGECVDEQEGAAISMGFLVASPEDVSKAVNKRRHTA